MRNFDNVTHEQAEQLLNWFFYRIKPDQRAELRAALPQAYDAFTGSTPARNSYNYFVQLREASK